METTRPPFDLKITPAQVNDIPQLAALINSAYRGETSRQGWTTEADLLDGRRTDAAQLAGLLTQKDSLLLQCRAGDELLGTVHLQYQAPEVRLGLLAVQPAAQDRGIGKHLLAAAETAARETWPARRLVMAVIPAREELIAFYQRRGYRRTGKLQPFPLNSGLWTPKVPGLTLELLEKLL